MNIFLIICLIITFIFGIVVFSGSPYVPSKKMYLQRALTNLYKLSSDDLLVDIGSGDGIVLREAAKKGAKAVGYEINPILVFISKIISPSKKISVNLASFWSAKFPAETTIVYVFTASRDIKKIYNKIQKEVNRLNKPVHMLSLGSQFSFLKVIKKDGPYFLYEIKPEKS